VVQLSVPVSRSSWIAARSRYVMTNPVYVLVGGQPIRSASDACYLLRSVEHLQDLVSSGRLQLWASEQEAMRAYEEARVELQRRFTEAGGGSCS
jgi:hypothetical protein